MTLAPYDAVLVQSFGGPRGPEDVVPFLRNVTAGRGIPDERLEEVGEHYYRFGGRSPINEQNQELAQALRAELAARGHDLPVAVGNRNWTPYGDDVLRELNDGGAARVLMLATSAYGSASSCRQYREDLGRYVPALREEGREIRVDKIRPYFQLAGFVEANVDAVVAAFEAAREHVAVGSATADAFEGGGSFPGGGGEPGEPGEPRLVFVTHSIPTAMNEASGAARPATYESQHRDVARRVAARAADRLGLSDLPWDLVFCSRSGSPRIPWLEPDVNDFLRAEFEAGRLGAGSGAPAVVLAPIGFISDHMEVLYDLDTEAAETCADLELPMRRAATVGTHPAFVGGLVDLLEARAAAELGDGASDGRLTLDTDLPVWTDVCPAGCCLLRPDQEGPPIAAGAEDSPAGL